MNTKNLRAYAPIARTQFIDAVKKRAAHFGIYEDQIEEVRIEGGAAIIEGRAFTRKEGEQRNRLESKVAERGYDMFIREMAYTWFNRLAALRYMEIHDYFDHGFRVLSPAKSNPTNSDSLPEILNHASEVADSLNLDKSHIIELQLAGDKEEELYRELLLGQCHHLSKIMPFMFEAIDDATELLLPNNLTKTDSILKGLTNDIPEEDWQEIEVIGWLYQFYISEHKDAVIGKVVKSEDIPAATQLFTPNWIVKYLVQNSVGRQWLATYPDSELKGKMEYYIEPAEQSEEVIEQLKAITPTSIDPEEIKVLDPACGSGHILVEVYEVLREVYLERGYRLREIPELILSKNIYGLDIDDRAAQLAGFALMMKAREDDRRIFQRVEDGQVSLNLFSLQSTEHLDILELWKALDLAGTQQTGATGALFEDTEVFVQPTGTYKEYFELLKELKSSFLQAKTLGSLIKIKHEYFDSLIKIREELIKKLNNSDSTAQKAALELLPIINQAIALAQEYDSVVANPPYIGSKYQTATVKSYLKQHYSSGDKDLFSAFILRNIELTRNYGHLGFMTPFVWMFISSYESLRNFIINEQLISSLVQLEYSGFDGATVPICTFILQKTRLEAFKGSYIRLADFKGAKRQAPKVREAILNKSCSWFYTKEQKEFKNLPGFPIAYWVNHKEVNLYKERELLSNVAEPRKGLDTGENDKFLRLWHEVSFDKICTDGKDKERTWFPYNKGGGYRRWYGNRNHVINWKSDGAEIKSRLSWKKKKPTIRNSAYYFKPGFSWGTISSGGFSARYSPEGALFDNGGCTLFADSMNQLNLFGSYLNSAVASRYLEFLSPTLNFQPGDIGRLLFPSRAFSIKTNTESCIAIAKRDWDLFERSWDFDCSPLLSNKSLIDSYYTFEKRCQADSHSLRELEEENNIAFAKGFGLDEQVDSKVSIEKVALDINWEYRFSNDEARVDKFRAETFVELISYSIGLMMGRYSLDMNGLVHAQSNNEAFKELEVTGAYNSFPVDDDGIIPLASEEWLFDDDATTRFKEFVKTVWGDEHLSKNLEFIAESLCLNALKPNKGESTTDTVRRYFSTQFFKDHCKTYKKRPIYWLFSSGKEKAFECLVYLHRYNEGTLSRMRTEYVTPLMGKYDAQHTLLCEQQLQATGTEARRIEKELKSLEKKQAELRTYDEKLKHYAEMRITLDLDEGVKANYGKFGNLLADVKDIHGKAVR